jgi:hypothetical protein
MTQARKRLIILVADGNMKAALKGLLTHPRALGIQITADDVDIFVHPLRDPGVYRSAHEFLRPYPRDYEHALVIFDREGCGVDEGKPRRRKRTPARKLQAEVQKKMVKNGWEEERCQVVVIDPELEMWVWNGSPAVAQLLQINPEEWRAMLSQGKPEAPKEELEKLLEARRIPRSSSLYEDLAKDLAMKEPWRLLTCNDSAFRCLRETLQKWFGEKEPSETGG